MYFIPQGRKEVGELKHRDLNFQPRFHYLQTEIPAHSLYKCLDSYLGICIKGITIIIVTVNFQLLP